MMFADIDAAGWVLIITAAVGAIGANVLQAMHMYLSYRRDVAIKTDVDSVAKATNGLTQKIVSAELIAERIVVKAEEKARDLLAIAARTAEAMKK